MTPLDLHRQRGLQRMSLALATMVIGFMLSAAANATAKQDRQDTPTPPYRYVVDDTAVSPDAGPLAALADRHVQLRQAHVVTAGGKTVAALTVAETRAGPVLLDWSPQVMRPFLRTLPSAQEVADLAPVLARHVPDDAVLLAWWDVSREFRLLTGLDVAFDKHLGIPLFLPVAWHDARERVLEIESRFWRPSTDAGDRARFQRFVHALLAEPQQGVAELRALARNKPAVVVLHVRDVILLGQLAPERIGVAFRDITWTGDVHGMVKSTYQWLEANGYSAYTVMRLDETNHQARVIALMDDASSETLAARLLPFIIKGESEDVPGMKLVYTTGGFWVYELAPAEDAGHKDTTS